MIMALVFISMSLKLPEELKDLKWAKRKKRMSLNMKGKCNL
jgi:hypothetical protein